MAVCKVKSVKYINGCEIIKVSGCFTMETTPFLQDFCRKSKIRWGRVNAILLDLCDVVKIDSSAFACMIDFILKHSQEKMRIGIIHPTKLEKSMMNILHLDNLISVYKNRADALKELCKKK